MDKRVFSQKAFFFQFQIFITKIAPKAMLCSLRN